MSKTWEDALKGWVIVSAAVVDDTTFAFSANWDETYHGPTLPSDVTDRLVYCDLKAATWGGKKYNGGFSFARSAGGVTPEGLSQALFATAGGYVSSFTFPDGPFGMEADMSARGAANLFFAGAHYYTYGLGNTFLRRNRPGDWTIISEATGSRVEQRRAGNITAGGGFSDDDIYLWNSGPLDGDPEDVIGHLLHWDGKSLTKLPVPAQLSKGIDGSPFWAHSICCVPDGRVFLSGTDGELVVGNRKTGFKVLVPALDEHLPGMNMAWFKGKLYGAIDFGLFSFDFKRNRWVGEPFLGDPNAPVNFPYIDANENVMLVAGGYGASIYDGERWARLAGDVSALDLTRLQLMEKLAGDTVTLRDIMRDLVEGQGSAS